MNLPAHFCPNDVKREKALPCLLNFITELPPTTILPENSEAQNDLEVCCMNLPELWKTTDIY